VADPTTSLAPRDAEALLESSWGRRGAPLLLRERLLELCLTLAFLAACWGLVVLVGTEGELDPMVVPVLAAYVASMRVAFPLGAGFAVPTQLFLVPLFAFAPAPVVPFLVVIGLAIARLIDIARGRARLDRLVLSGGNAIYTLGPALVLVASGHHDATSAPWPVVVLAFAAQLAFDLGSGIGREWLASGVRPQLQLRVQAQVWAVDAALTPLGLLAALGATLVPAAPLALFPLVLLLTHMARDRERRIASAHERLEALERERLRLREAVRRIGDAFASNLDLDGLLQILTRAAVDALDAEAGRASVFRGTRLLPRAVIEDADALASVIEAAEREAAARGGVVALGNEDRWALAAPIGTGIAPAGAVAVARHGAPFSAHDRDLFAYLCTQATVSAANVDRHETLHRQALTDELTGLANHRRFQDLLSAAVDHYQRTDTPVSLILLDLDNFKRINDTHGHQTGDMVLRAVAGCLREGCRVGDEPARYGGEELAVVLADTDLEHAAALAERLRMAVEQLTLVAPGDVPLRVTVSVGVATLRETAPTKTALIAATDAALYEAKIAGKNRVHRAAARIPAATAAGGNGFVAAADDVVDELRRALREDQLELHYQPKVTLPDAAVRGVEALLRWHHPVRGLLGPGAFLSRAEGSEAMPELTRWTISRGLAQAVTWRRAGLALPVAVNVTAQDVADRDFPATVARLIVEAGAEPGDLRLEITEHTVMSDAAAAQAALTELRRLGVGLSLDDFGTGHSSLTRLRDLPVDELKLDRGFLRTTAADADVAVIRAAVSLGRDLGLTVVAEGIEDARHWQLLGTMGCDLAQGFFIAPALRPVELERWLAERRPLAAG
jgi:diguanylate cyclase (GGDEF)-like protein